MAHRHLDPDSLPAEWGGDARRALSAVQGALSTEAEEDCLVCAGVAVLSEHGPHLLDRLADLAEGLAETLRATPGESDEGTAPTHRPPPPTTLRIDVSD
jgi:hypothetical protein